MIYLNQGKDYFRVLFSVIVYERSIKSAIQKHAFYSRLFKKKKQAINAHFSFNLSNSLFNQKLIAYTTLKI